MHGVLNTFRERLHQKVQPEVVESLLHEFSERQLYHRLLSTRLLSSSSKTEKDGSTHNGILYLAPANEVSKATLCPWSTKACREACIIFSGRLRMKRSRMARTLRTIFLLVEPDLFRAQLILEIMKHLAYGIRHNVQSVVRLNGTSDLQSSVAFKNLPEASFFSEIPTLFPEVQFIEYTKNPKFHQVGENQTITFSYSGTNQHHALKLLKQGKNVSVIFDGPFPETWNTSSVIDGDSHDNRFKDPQTGIVVGLKLKGTKSVCRKARQGKLAVPSAL